MDKPLISSKQGEGDSVQSPAIENLPKKTSNYKITILLAISAFLIFPLIYIIRLLSDIGKTSELFPQMGELLFLYVLVGSPIIAIIAKICTALSDGCLKQSVLADLAIILCSAMLLLSGGFVVVMEISTFASRVVCRTQIERLSTAIHLYANDHDGQLPLASQWCDLLLIHAEISPKSFVCPTSEAVEGESCFAINKYAVGKKLSELPADMILLFETNLGKNSEEETRQPIKNRENFEHISDFFYSDDYEVYLNKWNQIGGPENLISSHSDGAHVVWVNGYVEYVDFRNPNHWNSLESLRWDEAKTQYQFSDYLEIAKSYERPEPHTKSVIALAVIVTILGFVILVSTHIWKYTSLALPVSIGASIIGLVLGFIGESLYHSSYLRGIGACGSMALCFLAGLCYVGVLMKLQSRLKEKKSISQLAVSLGMLTGIACSTILHSALLLIYQDSHGLNYMLVAFPFGIAAGAILGAISGSISENYRMQSVSVCSQEGATR